MSDQVGKFKEYYENITGCVNKNCNINERSEEELDRIELLSNALMMIAVKLRMFSGLNEKNMSEYLEEVKAAFDIAYIDYKRVDFDTN